MNRVATTHDFEIAGYAFRFEDETSGAGLRFPDGFEPFRTTLQHTVDGHYHFVNEDQRPSDPPHPDHTYVCCDTWRFGQTTNGRYYMDIQYAPNNFWQPAAYLTQNFSSGLIFPKRYDANTLFPYSIFFPIDEQILLNRMALLHGALIHSCGINYEGKAVLFCGKSGAGKSTIADLWRAENASLMNDDRIIIRPLDGKYVAAATPWHGTVDEINPVTLPIAAVFHLHQATENRVEAIPFPQSAQRIIANAIAPFYLKSSMNKVLQTLTTAMQTIPSYNLYFQPNQDAIDTCRRILDV